jgi:hypothetical protein
MSVLMDIASHRVLIISSQRYGRNMNWNRESNAGTSGGPVLWYASSESGQAAARRRPSQVHARAREPEKRVTPAGRSRARPSRRGPWSLGWRPEVRGTVGTSACLIWNRGRGTRLDSTCCCMRQRTARLTGALNCGRLSRSAGLRRWCNWSVNRHCRGLQSTPRA